MALLSKQHKQYVTFEGRKTNRGPPINYGFPDELESFDKITDFVTGNVSLILTIPESKLVHSGKTSYTISHFKV